MVTEAENVRQTNAVIDLWYKDLFEALKVEASSVLLEIGHGYLVIIFSSFS